VASQTATAAPSSRTAQQAPGGRACTQDCFFLWPEHLRVAHWRKAGGTAIARRDHRISWLWTNAPEEALPRITRIGQIFGATSPSIAPAGSPESNTRGRPDTGKWIWTTSLSDEHFPRSSATNHVLGCSPAERSPSLSYVSDEKETGRVCRQIRSAIAGLTRYLAHRKDVSVMMSAFSGFWYSVTGPQTFSLPIVIWKIGTFRSPPFCPGLHGMCLARRYLPSRTPKFLVTNLRCRRLIS